MSDAETIIADVLRRTLPNRIWAGGCLLPSELAAEINKALGTLTREFGARMSGDTEITVVTEGTARYCANQHPQTWTVLTRYVTDWAEVTP